MDRLQELRARIDGVSKEIVALLDERFELVREVLEEKQKTGRPLYDPAREEMFLRAMVANSRGAVPEETVRDVFRLILDSSLEVMRAEDDTNRPSKAAGT